MADENVDTGGSGDANTVATDEASLESILGIAETTAGADSVSEVEPLQPGREEADSSSARFYDSFEDAALKELAVKKQWTSPEAIAKGYFNAETLLNKKLNGQTIDDFILKPGETATEEDRNAFFDALGRPESADKYTAPDAPENFAKDPTADWLKGVAHKNGFSQTQYENLISAYYEWAPTLAEDQEARLADDARQARSELEQEWGKDFASKVAIGNRAARVLKLDQQKLAGMGEVMGAKTATQLMAMAGASVSEDSFIGLVGSGQPSFDGMDAASLKAKLDVLVAKPEFNAALKNPALRNKASHKPMFDEHERLNNLLAQATVSARQSSG